MEKTYNFENVTVDKVVAALNEIPLATLVNITVDIAKRSKKKRITSGSMFFKDFCKTVAEQLVKPANYEILAKYHNLHNFGL